MEATITKLPEEEAASRLLYHCWIDEKHDNEGVYQHIPN